MCRWKRKKETVLGNKLTLEMGNYGVVMKLFGIRANLWFNFNLMDLMSVINTQ